MGPVHIALPSDVARATKGRPRIRPRISLEPDPLPPLAQSLDRMAGEIDRAAPAARRPRPRSRSDTAPSVGGDSSKRSARRSSSRRKPKGSLPEDHPQFFGVCAGVAADPLFVEFFERADLLVGVGFDPVESDKLWHQTRRLVSVAPVTIASDRVRPPIELTGDLEASLPALAARPFGAYDWGADERAAFRAELERTLRPSRPTRGGISP